MVKKIVKSLLPFFLIGCSKPILGMHDSYEHYCHEKKERDKITEPLCNPLVIAQKKQWPSESQWNQIKNNEHVLFLAESANSTNPTAFALVVKERRQRASEIKNLISSMTQKVQSNNYTLGDIIFFCDTFKKLHKKTLCYDDELQIQSSYRTLGCLLGVYTYESDDTNAGA